MARQSAGRRKPDETGVEQAEVHRDVADPEVDPAGSAAAPIEPGAEDAAEEGTGEPDALDEQDAVSEPDAVDEQDEPGSEDDEELERSARTDALWESVRVDVIELALPRGVGYTLRAYRSAAEVTPTDVSEREPDAFPERHRPVRSFVEDEKAIVDDYDDEDEDDDEPRGRRLDEEDDALDDDAPDDTDDEDALDEDEDEEGADDEAADEAGDAPAEGVPVFLGSRGHLYLFRSREGLAEFVRSDQPHDLSQVDTWSELAERITPADVVPLAEDRYELDLVVENLRGGYDAWDPDLLIQAGEIARDLGYALRLQSVMDSLAPGSPLDDLDEVMRTASGGGFSAFFARRKLKKIGAEAAPLSWRTIIGKISAAVDWRD